MKVKEKVSSVKKGGNKIDPKNGEMTFKIFRGRKLSQNLIKN